MRPRLLILMAALLLASPFWLPNSGAENLPTFEDFRSSDRERRATGQRETVDSLRLMHVDLVRVARVATENPKDPEVLWGAAELGGDWSTALAAGGTNAVVALRFACARAVKHDYVTALHWLRYCESHDVGNLVPWLGELWVLRQQGQTPESFHPPESATAYRDYAVPAARARVRVLEKAGYSPYSARRIGLMRNTFVESMAQDLSRDSVAQKSTAPFLLKVARAMQSRLTFLITELVGESLERAVLTSQPERKVEVAETRLQEIDDRREQLKQLVADTEQRTADFTTEAEMVQYFDDVLSFGEEIAMKRLQLTVQRGVLQPR